MTDQAELDPGTAFFMEAFEPATRVNPYNLYARMRETHPVLDGGNGLWLTFGHETAHTLLRARNVSSDERKSTEFLQNIDGDPRLQQFAESEPLMLFTDPPDHTRLRSLVSRAFTPRTVERMRPRLESLADELVDNIIGAGPIDVVQAIAYPFPVTVICELLGIPASDAPRFQSMSDDLTLTIEPGVLRTEEQELAIDTARSDLAAYIGELLEDRRKQPGEDLISALLAARDGEDRLSEGELISMITLLLLAGHETTVNLIGNSLVALLKHPDQLQLWRDDPSLIPNAVDELIRYDSPIQMAMRVMVEPTNIGGVMVPSGDQVICVVGAANRDPKVFADPDKLDLTRPNAPTNMSFGGGIHLCLGMALARTEGQVMLNALISRSQQLELVEEPEHRSRFVLRGYEKILINAS